MPSSKTIKTAHFVPLDAEEKQLAKDLDSGVYQSAMTQELEKTKLMFREAAEAYGDLNATTPITIRIKQLDILKVKSKAANSRLPYQTLLGMLIHKYANDELKMVV